MATSARAAPSASAFPSHGNQASPPTDAAQLTAAAALSQHDGAQDASGTANSRKRKASGAPGNRGVANLTPEQLAKKRANDREAQRAIRERTKTHIETLERRIAELESQQPFQELQHALRERDAAVAECIDLRQKMSTVAQVVGVSAITTGGGGGGQQQQQQQQHPGHAPGSLSGTFTFDDLIDPIWLTRETDAELAALTAQQSPLPPLGHQQPQHQTQHSQQYPPVSGPQYEPHIHPELQSPSYPPATHNSPVSSTSTAGPAYANGHGQGGPLRKWSPGLEYASGQHPHPHYNSQPNGPPYDYQRPPSAPMQPSHNGERLGLNFLLDSSQRTKTASPHNQPAYAPPQAQSHPSIPVYALLPNNSAATCPLDSLLMDFIANRRQRLTSGAMMQEVLGPEYPSWAALQDPNNAPRHDSHPVSALLIDMLSKFPDISLLPERVAVLYVMFLIMRWFICPCAACYHRLPEWVRPVTEQLERPHATWVDNVPWYDTAPDPFSEFLHNRDRAEEAVMAPAARFFAELLTRDRPSMRKRLTTLSALTKFDDFFVPFTRTLSLNWPYPSDQVLIPTKTDDGDGMALNPVFETHLRKLENWSLGSAFRAAFADLVSGEVRIEVQV
ncbi:hypothetical protein LTR36_002556 [Oleoguttula mirabilis]|uniref:BZIP transcription factor n=1 Tax=Oleoguttula mirabilis TaxID=1507867 RepID=A0AAV9JLW4_9PEZI|nr:hypothetical protein LTR36_002556 [Oleoguttula mirabilis]